MQTAREDARIPRKKCQLAGALSGVSTLLDTFFNLSSIHSNTMTHTYVQFELGLRRSFELEPPVVVTATSSPRLGYYAVVADVSRTEFAPMQCLQSLKIGISEKCCGFTVTWTLDVRAHRRPTK